DGAPVKGLPGRIVEPGHQFEWAFLLLRARPGDDEIRKTARRLFEIAERHGVDPMRRVAIDSLLDDFSPHAKQARLWPQTERLRAAIALAALAEGDARAACERTALAAAEGLTAYLRVKVPGLWRDRMRADGTFVNEPAPASSLYHIAGAVLELRNYVRNSHLS
ncbi:MAG TPA: AGE family epimerase/isomerase, partial [Rhizomicrobium sp.]|nr:AGE family epimerase/isomerase [Rhizomicrobium sp.]